MIQISFQRQVFLRGFNTILDMITHRGLNLGTERKGGDLKRNRQDLVVGVDRTDVQGPMNSLLWTTSDKTYKQGREHL